jgi:signal transduction histidine kinase
VLRDRTDVRTMTVALQNRLLAAEEQNAQRLAAVAALAHELRNQVSPLVNLLGALERTGGEQPATASMRRQLDVTARLLDDLAESAAVVAAAPALEIRTVDIQEAVLRAAEGMASLVQQRRQLLKVTLPDTPILIDGDPRRINQMLVNLLGNASKFTPAEGHIQASATVEDDMVAIRVEDNGAGIDPDVLPRIFDLFTREVRADAPQGLGVGLSVVKSLAELHGGFVEGRSLGRDRGSIFTVRLPVRSPSRPPR